VSEFRYLCSLISEDGYCEKEIHNRIAMEKKIFMDKKRLFTGKLNLELKKQIIYIYTTLFTTNGRKQNEKKDKKEKQNNMYRIKKT